MPGRFASTDEIVELAKVAQQYGGIYISHQRSESGQIMSSLDEVFAVAERANIPAEVWHLKTAYKANWGRMPEVLKRFEDARARGLDVTANMYPYDRASNGLDACLPLWVREGGLDQMLARLKDPSLRDRIKRDMDDRQRQGLGEPVVRIRRRRRRDDLDRARSRRSGNGKARTSSRSARRWARIRATRRWIW